MLAKKKNIIILVVSLAILGAIIATICVFLLKTQPAEIDPRSFEEIFWDSETSEEAIETFQKKIDATPDPIEKADLYNERSNYLFLNATDETHKDQIIYDAEESNKLNPTYDSEMYLEIIYGNYNIKKAAE